MNIHAQSLNWKQVGESWYADYPGMVRVELTPFSDGSPNVQIMINGQDMVIEGTVAGAIAWIEGYIAGRFQEMKLEVKMSRRSFP
jgi:hypothetical protein